MQGPRFERLVDALDHFAATTPDADAVWFEGVTLSYRELAARVDHLAAALAGWGVRQGDRVAVLSTPRTEFLVAMLAVHKAGAVYLGVNPSYTPREQLHVVADSEPCLVLSLAAFAGREFAAEVEALSAAVPSIRGTFRLDDGPPTGCLTPLTELLAHAADAPPLPHVTAQDPAALVYTSGSSGAPKGALLPHIAMAYAAHCDADGIAVPTPRVACNLPTNHIGCIIDVCGTALVTGGMLAFVEQFDPGGMLEMVESLHLTTLQHVPTVLQLVAAHPDFATRDLSSLKAVAWGGAPMPIDVVRVYRALGLRMVVVYGMTESCANITFTTPDATDEVLAGTVGRPNPDAEVRVVRDDGTDTSDGEEGEEGEVWYRHPARMLGYWKNPEATAAAVTADGWLRTGDLAVRRPDGNLVLVGRRSEMFKSGGLNVYPREVELVLEAHPGVAMAAVVGVPDPVYSEVGAAFVMAEPGVPAPDAEALRAWCKEQLAGYKVPKRFEVRAALPLLPVGKVDKKALRAEITG